MIRFRYFGDSEKAKELVHFGRKQMNILREQLSLSTIWTDVRRFFDKRSGIEIVCSIVSGMEQVDIYYPFSGGQRTIPRKATVPLDVIFIYFCVPGQFMDTAYVGIWDPVANAYCTDIPKNKVDRYDLDEEVKYIEFPCKIDEIDDWYDYRDIVGEGIYTYDAWNGVDTDFEACTPIIEFESTHYSCENSGIAYVVNPDGSGIEYVIDEADARYCMPDLILSTGQPWNSYETFSAGQDEDLENMGGIGTSWFGRHRYQYESASNYLWPSLNLQINSAFTKIYEEPVCPSATENSSFINTYEVDFVSSGGGNYYMADDVYHSDLFGTVSNNHKLELFTSFGKLGEIDYELQHKSYNGDPYRGTGVGTMELMRWKWHAKNFAQSFSNNTIFQIHTAEAFGYKTYYSGTIVGESFDIFRVAGGDRGSIGNWHYSGGYIFPDRIKTEEVEILPFVVHAGYAAPEDMTQVDPRNMVRSELLEDAVREVREAYVDEYGLDSYYGFNAYLMSHGTTTVDIEPLVVNT